MMLICLWRIKGAYLVVVLKKGDVEKKMFVPVETNGKILDLKSYCFVAGHPAKLLG